MKIAVIITFALGFSTAHADLKCTDLTQQQFVQLAADTNPSLIRDTATFCKDESDKYKSLAESKNRECSSLPQTAEGNKAFMDCRLQLVELQINCLKSINRGIALLQVLAERLAK